MIALQCLNNNCTVLRAGESSLERHMGWVDKGKSGGGVGSGRAC